MLHKRFLHGLVFLLALAALLLLTLSSTYGQVTEEPVPTDEVTPMPTETLTPVGTSTPTASPTSTPTPSPTPTSSKSLTESLGANALGGALGGAAGNYVFGVNQLTGAGAALVSGVVVGAGSAAGTLLWNIGRAIFDPPEGPVNQPELWRWVPILLLVILALLAALVYSARQPAGRNWAKAIAAAILLGLAVGLGSLLVDQATGWGVIQGYGPVIFLVYGIIAGLLEHLMLRGVGRPR